MFSKISGDRAESSQGFAVELLGVHELKYTEGNRAVKVEIEPGANAFLVYAETIREWLPPCGNEPISLEKRREILRRIDEALRFLKVPHVVVK